MTANQPSLLSSSSSSPATTTKTPKTITTTTQTIQSKNAPSNSIIITCLSEAFFHPNLQLAIGSHLASYGSILSWNSLPNLARILVVYSNSNSALMAKTEMDQFTFEESELRELLLSLLDNPQDAENDTETLKLLDHLERTVIRVYFGPQITAPTTSTGSNTSITIEGEDTSNDLDKPKTESADRLKPPNLDKNFLISPPGSPPVGWEQIVEDPPNQNDLAEDLCKRLRFLSVEQEDDQIGLEERLQQQNLQQVHSAPNSSKHSSLHKEIIILPAQPSLQLPALKIQPIQTLNSSPGMNIHLVKATIESMMVYSNNNKISPTPRPQIS